VKHLVLAVAVALTSMTAPAGAAGADATPAWATWSWASPDGHVHLTYPAIVTPSRRTVAGNYFFAKGWRVFWGGDPGPGSVVISFTRAARPALAHASARESLQIGVSHDEHVVADCLHAGLPRDGGSVLPKRTINGTRFRVYSRSDQAMSQGTTTVDLRAVVGGACYAVDRISESANSEGSASVTLSQTDAAAAMDQTLATLRLTP
jgi:hypothetical protein